MTLFPLVHEFILGAERIQSPQDLNGLLSLVTSRLGFHHFALTHHVDILHGGLHAIRLHNYPAEWAEYFDTNALGVSDPVHRASHVTGAGFVWSKLPLLIPMTPTDRKIIDLAARHGIGEGFTVPANVPGESNGSVSFAMRAGEPLPACALPAAQLIGTFAFEGARRIWRMRSPPIEVPLLTDRQRDCLLWVGRGKSDWEVSRILGISEETVVRHVKQARQRYGVQKRTSLLMLALMDGTISLADVVKH